MQIQIKSEEKVWPDQMLEIALQSVYVIIVKFHEITPITCIDL